MSRVEESSNQQTQDSMENLLTEDDIGDLAAAVGDGADESDDSLRVSRGCICRDRDGNLLPNSLIIHFVIRYLHLW